MPALPDPQPYRIGRNHSTAMQTLTPPEDDLQSVIADRLFIFDMDGTLLIQTAASIEIAKITGTVEQLHILEKTSRVE